jgi:hypothetical protein
LAVLGEVIKIDGRDKLIARRHIHRPPELIRLEVELQVRDRNQVYSTHTVL